METRVFGTKDDKLFWSDKPIQNKPKWYHIHWYNIPYNPVHKSSDGTVSETIKVTLYKCRCGKSKFH